jgi:hypothetical protein
VLITDLIEQVRREANEPLTGGFIGDTEWSDILTEGLYEIYTRVKIADQNHFEGDRTIALVGGTQEYELPTDIVMRSITDVKLIDTDGRRLSMNYVRHQDVPSTPSSTGRPYLYYIRDTKIGFWPIPDGSMPSYRVTFYRQPNAMFTSYPQSSAAVNRFIYSKTEGAAATQGRIGRLPTRNDDFVGEIIRFHPGSGADGEEYRITAHNVLTAELTVTPNLSANVTGGLPAVRRFSIVPFLAEEFRSYLVHYAMKTCHQKQGNMSLFAAAQTTLKEWEAQVLAGIELRRMDEPRMVREVEGGDSVGFSDLIF